MLKNISLVLVFGLTAFSQTTLPNPQDVQQIRGVTTISSYSVSDLETINTTTGNVFFHLPIISLPPGRAGQSAGVSLVYNSNAYDLAVSGDVLPPNNNCAATYDLQPSDLGGGWQLGVGYKMRYLPRPTSPCIGLQQVCDGMGNCVQQQAICVGDGGTGEYQWRFELDFPDGSSHTLAPVGFTAGMDGYWPVDFNGTIWACTSFTTSPLLPSRLVANGSHSLSFYTVDGTFARVQLVPGDPQHFTVFFADGRKVSNTPQQANIPLTIATVSPLPAGAVGTNYQQVVNATGGAGGYRWSLASGTLPPGVSLSPAGPSPVPVFGPGGLLSGLPSTAQAYNFSLRVTDALGATFTSPTYSLTIQSAASLTITTSLSDTQALKTNISDTLVAAGGLGTYTWSSLGTLPSGLTMSSAGVLSGTPTQAGIFNFTVQANDGHTTASGSYCFIVEDPQGYVQTMTDRNGNNETLQFEFDLTALIASATLTDDIGRSISVDQNWTINGTGGGGAALTWTTTRNMLQSTQLYARYDSPPCCPVTLTNPLPQIPVVTKLQVPSQLGGGSYTFDYNGNPLAGFTGSTSFSGQLKTITLPTGATVAYNFGWDNPPSPLEARFWPETSGVQQKTVSFGGQAQEIWGYNITVPQGLPPGAQLIGSSTVTAPDGGLTQETYWNGLAINTTLPDGTTIERIWQLNDPFQVPASQTLLTQALSLNDQIYNPYVAREYRSLAQGSTCQSAPSTCITAITETAQDLNGNVVDTKEHEFVAYSSLQRSGQLPSQTPGIVKRETISTFAVPNLSISNNCATGYYCDPGAPRVGNSVLNRKVLDPSGTAVAYSEFSYDDGTGKSTANLSQTARWDTTKSSALTPPLSGANAVITSLLYTPHGNVQSVTDANVVVTQYSYGVTCNGNSDLYPTTATRAFGTPQAQATQFTSYDCGVGLPTSQTGPDTIPSTTLYDSAGRITQVSRLNTTLFDRSFHDPASADPSVYTISRLHLDQSSLMKKVTVQRFDPLYRLSLTQELESTEPSGIGSDTTSGIKTDRHYSFTSAGNYELVSNPYRSTTDDTMGWTRTLRDTSGRVTEIKSFVGGTMPAPFSSNGVTSGAATTFYSLNTTAGAMGSITTTQDQNLITRASTTDRLGRLVQVLEGGAFMTQHVYDGLDNLTTVTQTGNQGTVQRNFTYSSLGRLLTADNPETRSSANPTRTIVYVYDNNGNLSTRTDTRLVQASYGYDELNRITSKSYAGTASTITANLPSPTASVFYCYDGNTAIDGNACPSTPPAASTSTGHLTAVTSTGSTTLYLGFDNFGSPTGKRQRTGGVNYDFGYTYNPAGMLSSVTYPNPGAPTSTRTMTYTIDLAGRTSAVNGSLGGGTATPYATVASFWPHGAIQTLNLNNAVTETTDYNARLQPLSIAAKLGTTNLVGLTYNYCADFSDVDAAHTCASNNGNVTRQQIGFDAIAPAVAFSEAQVYQYNDVANRLTKASTASWTQPNLFDAVGNRWVDQANLVGLPAPTGETPIASSWFTAQNRINGWGYDEMGNVEAVGSMSRSFIYDAENRQVQATINGSVIGYTYDGDGRRVAKTAPGLDAQGNPTIFTTTFVYDTDGQLAQEYSQAPATDSGTSYLTADHLGSTRLVTDGSGGVKKRFDYLPFGEELTAGTGGRTTDMRYNSSSTAAQPDVEPLKFTSKERDAETGLDYFGARYMSSAQGRWTSPDLVNLTDDRIVNPSNTLNKYIYGGNNPLKYTDPDGRDITVLYEQGAPTGHVMMAAVNQQTGDSAILSVGPATQHDPNAANPLNWFSGVPGTTTFNLPTTADELRQNFAALTIQTSPEVAQQAIDAIRSGAGSGNWALLGNNCTSACAKVLHDIGLLPNGLYATPFPRPNTLWNTLRYKYQPNLSASQRSNLFQNSGSLFKVNNGTDYGSPRFGMNTFDFIMLTLPKQEKVTSKICFTDENGKQVCQ